MVLNEFNTEGVKVSFVYMPSWEMFMSMHVLAVPEHHLERRRWYQRIKKEHGNLVEHKDEGIPQDFLNVFRALGDETRLKIIREILNGTRTTKALAGKVEVTEAAVSKHLKILWEAGLLEKKRCGNYVEYYVCRDVNRLAMNYGKAMGALLQEVWMFSCFCGFVLIYTGRIRMNNWYLLPAVFALLMVASAIWGVC